MQDFIKLENVSLWYTNNEDEQTETETKGKSAKNTIEQQEELTENQLERLVLDNISLTVGKGEFVALIGHNGSGKSTMAKLFNSLLVPSKGIVTVNGLDTCDEKNDLEIRKRVGLILQNPDNQIVASIVEEDVAFGPENLGLPPEEIRRRVDDSLKLLDMYEYREHAPHRLSGGQKQRVAIAGIIAMQPECIVLDEPTAMLDPKGRQEVMSSITRLNKENGITIILITHHMDEAVAADRIVVLDEGHIIIDGTAEEVFSKADMLKKHRLDVPQATELCHRLRENGINIDNLPLTTAECITTLEGVLQNQHNRNN